MRLADLEDGRSSVDSDGHDSTLLVVHSDSRAVGPLFNDLESSFELLKVGGEECKVVCKSQHFVAGGGELLNQVVNVEVEERR